MRDGASIEVPAQDPAATAAKVAAVAAPAAAK
jgi:hypothetical protein